MLKFITFFKNLFKKEGAGLKQENKNLKNIMYGIINKYIELKRKFHLLEKIAYTDTLTDIPNYTTLQMDIERLAKDRQDSPVVLMMVDLDKFKYINDTFGHIPGDLVLITLAKIISEVMREDDKFYRKSGDEFVVILSPPRNGGEIDIDELVERILKVVSEHDWEGLGCWGDKDVPPVTISVGITSGLLSKFSLEDLIKKADKALYIAKETKGNKACFS